MSDSEKPTAVETTEVVPSIWKIRIEGALDSTAFRKIDQAVQELFKMGISKIIIDLRDAARPDSTGIGTFIAYHDQATKSGGRIVFLHCPVEIKDMFLRLGLDALFRFAESEEAAVAFQGGGSPSS